MCYVTFERKMQRKKHFALDCCNIKCDFIAGMINKIPCHCCFAHFGASESHICHTYVRLTGALGLK